MVFRPGIKSKSNLLFKNVAEVKKEAYCCKCASDIAEEQFDS